MTIFRVMRDDDFLRQMLLLISRFNSTYVKAKRPPPANMFFDRSDYQVRVASCLWHQFSIPQLNVMTARHDDTVQEPAI